MKILILGGTGAMGEHLVGLLHQSNNEVIVTSRKFHDDVNNIHYCQGDAHNEDFLKNLLDSSFYDVIVDFMYYGVDEFKHKVDLLLKHTCQYICLSSSRVYANSKSPIKETNKFLSDVINDPDYLLGHDYSIEKCRIEDLLKTSIYKNWTIIRPYITYSENRLQLGIYELNDWFYRYTRGRTIQISKRIADSYTTLTYGLDVSKGILSVLGKKETLGQAFNITCSKPIKWIDVLLIYVDEIEKSSGVKPKYIITDKDIYTSIGLNDAQVSYDRTYNRVFDNSKISEFCDTSAFVEPSVGLRSCISEFLRKPKVCEPFWWRQALIDRLTGECASADEFSNKKEYKDYLHVLAAKNLYICNKYYRLKRKIKYLLFRK